MKTQIDKASCLALLITGLAIVLFSTAGIARMLGWGPGSISDSDDVPALEVPAAGEAAAGPRCPECGVVVSTGAHEITVRMADGSSRVINHASPARWRAGERLIVIAGTASSQP